jgi:OmpA-OmpF porin, OOP family
MNKSVKLLTMAAVLAAAPVVTMAQTDIQATTAGDWRDASSRVIQDPFGLCWRTGYFSPDLAQVECDPDLVPKAAPAPAPAPAPVAPVAPAPAPKAPAAPVNEKVTYAADTFFDFNKANLKPQAKAALDDLVSKLKGINLEVIIAVGHTDGVGGDAYNQKLSVQRAESVKGYLVSKGIEPNRIYTEGKGKKQPIAPNSINGKDNPDGRAKNRRVEIEVVGTRAK